MPHLDATPENSNDEACDVCNAEPNMPCVYSTNPPIARDRMHYQRVEAAQKAQPARKALRPAHEIEIGLASGSSSNDPITATLRVTDSNTGKILHNYDMSEHDFVRLLRGGVVRVSDEMTGGL